MRPRSACVLSAVPVPISCERIRQCQHLFRRGPERLEALIGGGVHLVREQIKAQQSPLDHLPERRHDLFVWRFVEVIKQPI